MRLIDGLAEWWSDLGKIYMTPEVRGIERTFDLINMCVKDCDSFSNSRTGARRAADENSGEISRSRVDSVPAQFQFRRHQTIGRVGGVVLAERLVCRVAGGFEVRA